MITAAERMQMARTLGRCVVDHVDREAGEYRPLGAAAGSMVNSEWWRTVPTASHRGEVLYGRNKEDVYGICDEASGEIG